MKEQITLDRRLLQLKVGAIVQYHKNEYQISDIVSFEEVIGVHLKTFKSEILRIDDKTFEVKGTISLYELERILDVELPTEDFETLNGFFTHLLGGDIPPMDQVSRATYKDIQLTTLLVSEKRIEKILLQL